MDQTLEGSFAVEIAENHIRITGSSDAMTFRGTIHLEDMMNLEEAPVLPLGSFVRTLMYKTKIVHSGTGIDNYPDAELLARLHAGYDTVDMFLVGIDRNNIGYCDFNDIIQRASKFGIKSVFRKMLNLHR